MFAKKFYLCGYFKVSSSYHLQLTLEMKISNYSYEK